MRTKISLVLFASLLVPATAFALEGVGPRVTIVGTITDISMTQEQKFNKNGADVVVHAANGQDVKVKLDPATEYLFEGKQTGRGRFKSTDLQPNMQIRVRGWRQGSDAMNVSLVVILNAEKNSQLTWSGIVDSAGAEGIAIKLANGDIKKFSLDNATEVNVDYQVYGIPGLTLVGKYAYITLNPQDLTQAKIIRIVKKALTN